MHKPDCIFCKIALGQAPARVILEDDNHMAFLSIMPNTEGFTVVIPKHHQPSYFAEVDPEVVSGLMQFSAKVAKILDQTFPDVGRTGLIFEGFGVDHLHSKLVPMHGTKSGEWKQHTSSVDKYFDMYEGYISSHNYGEPNRPEIDETYKKFNL